MALAIILFKGLKATDYRILDNINREVYKHFMHSSYAEFSADLLSALKRRMNSTQSIKSLWGARLDNCKIKS